MLIQLFRLNSQIRDWRSTSTSSNSRGPSGRVDVPQKEAIELATSIPVWSLGRRRIEGSKGQGGLDGHDMRYDVVLGVLCSTYDANAPAMIVE